MKKLAFLCMFALAPFAFVGCEPSPAEQQADQIEENAENQADAIEESADDQAEMVDESGDAQADAVRAEGDAAADAVREEGDDPAGDADTLDPNVNPVVPVDP